MAFVKIRCFLVSIKYHLVVCSNGQLAAKIEFAADVELMLADWHHQYRMLNIHLKHFLN